MNPAGEEQKIDAPPLPRHTLFRRRSLVIGIAVFGTASAAVLLIALLLRGPAADPSVLWENAFFEALRDRDGQAAQSLFMAEAWEGASDTAPSGIEPNAGGDPAGPAGPDRHDGKRLFRDIVVRDQGSVTVVGADGSRLVGHRLREGIPAMEWIKPHLKDIEVNPGSIAWGHLVAVHGARIDGIRDIIHTRKGAEMVLCRSMQTDGEILAPRCVLVFHLVKSGRSRWLCAGLGVVEMETE